MAEDAAFSTHHITLTPMVSFFSKLKTSLAPGSTAPSASAPPPAQQFWTAFTEQVNAWRSLPAREFLDSANKLLHRFFPEEIVVEISGQPATGPVEMLFSSNGEVAHFPAIFELAQTAPALPGFRAVAFRQASSVSADAHFRMNGVDLSPSEIYVSPSNDNGKLGLQVAFANKVAPELVDAQEHLAFIALDHLLGEWFMAIKVGPIDFVDAVEQLATPSYRLSDALEPLNIYWTQTLGHDGVFPKGEGNYSLLEARGPACPEGRDADIVINLHCSAAAVACRADLMYLLRIDGRIENARTSERFYELDERLTAQWEPLELGVFAFRETFLSEDRWSMVFYVHDAPTAQATAESLARQVFRKSSVPQVSIDLDPRWDAYFSYPQ